MDTSPRGQWDVRGALRDLLNLKELEREPESAFYGGNDTPAEEFISRYGSLRGLPALEDMLKPIAIARGAEPTAVRSAAALLRSMFLVHNKGESALPLLNSGLAAIFGPAVIAGEQHPPGLRVDILAGTIEPRPRDLLDAIALEFMRSYRMIGRCVRCDRFFFKTYPRDKYCGGPCGDAARADKQRDWMRAKRAADAERKRKRESKRKRRGQ